MVPMILRPICMSQRATGSHHEQCAIDQRYKPDKTHILTKAHHDLTTAIVSIRHI
jgi:hypothetical protein